MTESADYRVSLDVYSGPLELLLFLIRREEIDIYDIPIARITEQYIEYVDLLRELDPEVVSEFLVLAATLMEIKSRTLLPRPPAEEDEEEIVDPRLELVQQLLEYKKFKDAARTLEDAAAERARKHERSPVAPPLPEDEFELENLDIWDLFDAFNRVLKQIGRAGAVHRVEVDDTPVALHADDILDFLQREESAPKFEDIFIGRTKGEMIGMFLALLELIRERRIRVVQDRPFGTILIYLIDPTPLGEIPEPEVSLDDGTFDYGDDELCEDSAAMPAGEALAQMVTSGLAVRHDPASEAVEADEGPTEAGAYGIVAAADLAENGVMTDEDVEDLAINDGEGESVILFDDDDGVTAANEPADDDALSTDASVDNDILAAGSLPGASSDTTLELSDNPDDKPEADDDPQ